MKTLGPDPSSLTVDFFVITACLVLHEAFFITHVGPASLRALHTSLLTKTKMHYEKENLSNHYNV